MTCRQNAAAKVSQQSCLVLWGLAGCSASETGPVCANRSLKAYEAPKTRQRPAAPRQGQNWEQPLGFRVPEVSAGGLGHEVLQREPCWSREERELFQVHWTRSNVRSAKRHPPSYSYPGSFRVRTSFRAQGFYKNLRGFL